MGLSHSPSGGLYRTVEDIDEKLELGSRKSPPPKDEPRDCRAAQFLGASVPRMLSEEVERENAGRVENQHGGSTSKQGRQKANVDLVAQVVTLAVLFESAELQDKIGDGE